MSCVNKKPEQKSPCGEGKPVNPILGCKILTEEPDVVIDGYIPLVWRRTYASDVEYEGMLGQGWSMEFGFRLEILEDRIHLYDGYGKKDVFPKLSIGSSHTIPKNSLELQRPQDDVYVYTFNHRYYYFHASTESKGLYRLVSIKDANDNALNFFYEEEKTFPSYLSMDNHRLFVVQSNGLRVLGLEELLFDTSSLVKNLLQTKDALYLVYYHKDNERTRVSSIEKFALDKQEDLEEEHHEALETKTQSLVRYVYDGEDNLSEVYHKNNLLVRTFTYKNHMMTSHKVPEGLESYYEYTQYKPSGKVLRNTTNTGQSWDFNYQKDHTIVTDALGRETIYNFDADNYFTSKLDPLHQEMTLKYDNLGQLVEIEDVTGAKQSFGYDEAKGVLNNSEDANNNSTYYTYDPRYKKPIIMKNTEGETKFFYDRQENLLRQILPNTKTIEYTRDKQGNTTELKDALGGLSLFAYNLSGNLTQHINPKQQTTTLTYDNNENLVQVTDIYGDSTDYSYDSQDRLVQINYANKATEHYSYNPLGSLKTHTSIFGAVTTYTTDKAGNLVSLTNSKQNTIHYHYDVEERLQVEIDTSGNMTKYMYDDLDRVIASQDSHDDMLVYAYTKHNTLQSIIDPVGNTTEYSYDTQGNLRLETQANQANIQTTYAPRANTLATIKRQDGSML